MFVGFNALLPVIKHILPEKKDSDHFYHCCTINQILGGGLILHLNVGHFVQFNFHLNDDITANIVKPR